jgi:hypothetical protein
MKLLGSIIWTAASSGRDDVGKVVAEADDISDDGFAAGDTKGSPFHRVKTSCGS